MYFVAAICLIGGFIIGFGSGISIKDREKKNESIHYCDEVLIDAKANKEIAQTFSSYDQSEKGKILAQLTKMVNEAAQQGQQRLYIQDHELNDRIERHLSKRDVESYFFVGGYRVEFMYKFLDSSRISFISWE